MGYNNDHYDDILLQIIVSDESLQNNVESFRRLKRISNKIKKYKVVFQKWLSMHARRAR